MWSHRSLSPTEHPLSERNSSRDSLSEPPPPVIQGLRCGHNRPTARLLLMASTLPSAIRALVRTLLALPLALLLFSGLAGPAMAAQWTPEQLTVPADPDGNLVTFNEQEIRSGRKLFNNSCGECHAGGITKTNQNVGLDPETLALATPARDNVASLVDYMKDPTSYDGEYSISDVHPSLRSSDIFVKMRDLDDEDLRDMAGYILVAPKVQGVQWGGGKIYF
jgi:photosystem II cytochrome c550